jgi:uncharacterized membrane protein
MEFLQTTGGIIMVSLFALALTCFISYFIIKLAVKDALREVQKEKESRFPEKRPIPPPTWSAAQVALQSRYEKGEINIEEYTKEWNKL